MNRLADAPSSDQIAAEYQSRFERYALEQRQFDRQANRLSNWRALAFAAMVGAGVAGLAMPDVLLLWLLVAVGLFVVFVVLVRVHARVLGNLVRAARLAEVNREALARHRRDWDQLPKPVVAADPKYQSTAKDLDLFGRASLYQIMAPPHTPAGVQLLKSWLIDPAEPAEIVERQQAIQGLAPALDWRQELDLYGRLLGADAMHPERFVAWAESPSWLTDRSWLVWLARLSPLVLLLLAIAQAIGALAGAWWMVLVLVNVVVSFLVVGRVHAIFNRISTRQGEIRQFGELFALAAKMPATVPELQRIQAELAQLGGGAHAELGHLGKIMDLANLRYSAMVYGVVQALTLWDIHVLVRIERWQRRSGHFAARWFAALGRLEALAGIASLAHDQPRWTYPRVDASGEPVVAAQGLGHPLLSDKARVSNDVTVGPPGSLLLVTGSNMSGKSTLLRSIGTNIVLAQAGGPVCASQLSLPPLRLATSMRVQDSLEDGVSFFLAELKRLKEAVDAARDGDTRQNRRLLYLFDEILQGTNTVERQIAVRTVLKHLLAQGAIGAISTHDLDLANSPELAQSCRPVHFRESFTDGPTGRRMTFDYQLRQGVATTTNALKLLEMVGLADSSAE